MDWGLWLTAKLRPASEITGEEEEDDMREAYGLSVNNRVLWCLLSLA